MDIIEVVKTKLVEMFEDDAKVLEISLVGSSVLKTGQQAPMDVDYLVLCSGFMRKNKSIKFSMDNIRYDLMIYDIDEYKRQLTFQPYYLEHEYYNVYQCVWANLRIPVWGSLDLEWSILDYENTYKIFLKNRVFHSVLDPLKPNRIVSGKMFIAAYLALTMFKNRSIELTNEMIVNANVLYSGNAKDANVKTIIDWIGHGLELDI